MLFASLLQKKSETIEDGLEMLEEMVEITGKPPKFVRLDRSGET